ncbi:MAG: peptide chain release factor-like protein [Parachlamydiales bacterium]|nr:peptide chain release factor-like protein [Parachlamydiales bacterium]
MPIRLEKEEELTQRMLSLGILEKDLEEQFILGSGRGGQKLQKSHSCVYLKHIPSGIEVKCHKERSREMNRFFARRELCDKIEESLLGRKSKKMLLQEKKRKQKKRRERRQKI